MSNDKIRLRRIEPEKIRQFILINNPNKNIKQFEFAINKGRGAFEFFARDKNDIRSGGVLLYDKKLFKKTGKPMSDLENIKMLIKSIFNKFMTKRPKTIDEKIKFNNLFNNFSFKINKTFN